MKALHLAILALFVTLFAFILNHKNLSPTAFGQINSSAQTSAEEEKIKIKNWEQTHTDSLSSVLKWAFKYAIIIFFIIVIVIIILKVTKQKSLVTSGDFEEHLYLAVDFFDESDRKHRAHLIALSTRAAVIISESHLDKGQIIKLLISSLPDFPSNNLFVTAKVKKSQTIENGFKESFVSLEDVNSEIKAKILSYRRDLHKNGKIKSKV